MSRLRVGVLRYFPSILIELFYKEKHGKSAVPHCDKLVEQIHKRLADTITVKGGSTKNLIRWDLFKSMSLKVGKHKCKPVFQAFGYVEKKQTSAIIFQECAFH